jgi:hypothetical protein
MNQKPDGNKKIQNQSILEYTTHLYNDGICDESDDGMML